MSGEGGSPTGFEGFGGAAKSFVEFIRDVGGIVIEPATIRRRAKAEGEAMIIKAEHGVQAMDIVQRARVRFEEQEIRRQKNLEAIAAEARDEIEKSGESGTPKQIDPDWTQRFINYAQDYSDEQMRTLWSRILSGEYRKPGSFSLRTLNILNAMSQRDAELFRLFAEYVVFVYEMGLWISGTETGRDFSRYGKMAGLLNHLQAIGLIESNTVFTGDTHYFEWNSQVLKTKKTNGRQHIGFQSLSNVGLELLKICELKHPPNILDRIKKTLESKGYEVEIVSQLTVDQND